MLLKHFRLSGLYINIVKLLIVFSTMQIAAGLKLADNHDFIMGISVLVSFLFYTKYWAIDPAVSKFCNIFLLWSTP